MDQMWHEYAGKKGYKKVRFKDEREDDDEESGYDTDDVPDMVKPSADSNDEGDDTDDDEEEEVNAPAPRVRRAGRAPN